MSVCDEILNVTYVFGVLGCEVDIHRTRKYIYGFFVNSLVHFSLAISLKMFLFNFVK